MRTRGTAIAVVLLVIAGGAIAYLVSTRDSSGGRRIGEPIEDDRKPHDAPTAIAELPFPRGDPDGHRFGDGRVKVVEGSEVLSIIDGDYGFVVVLRIMGDVETVIDLYAEEFGCGLGSAFEHNMTVCNRTRDRLERYGMAGSDFYSLVVGETPDDGTWVGVLSYARG